MSLRISAVQNQDLAGADVVGVVYFEGLATESSFEHCPSADVLTRRGFEAKLGQVAPVESASSVVYALGAGSASDLDAEAVRRVVAAFVRATSRIGAAEVHLDMAGLASSAEMSTAASEAALMAFYRYRDHKTGSDDRRLQEVKLASADANAVQRGIWAGEATCLARDLINTPPSEMTPVRMAEVAIDKVKGSIEVEVWDEQRIAQERLGGLAGVAAGSDQPPRLVRMRYRAPGATRTLSLIGKGITFDSGGLSLKPAEGMMTMKTDMSGAAAVIAVMSVIENFAPSVNVLAYVALTENLPGPSATKPGDVLRARNGKTMEVLNTDAEGRLVLADALSLAVEQGVDAMVDVATLTGACVVALGPEIAGLMANNDELAKVVEESSAAAGEAVWRLPLPARYRKHIDSEVADIKNTGAARGSGGALSAGLFLKEFVADTPWAHLDIAGPARAEGDDGYIAKGATGFGVRTLLELVSRW